MCKVWTHDFINTPLAYFLPFTTTRSKIILLQLFTKHYSNPTQNHTRGHIDIRTMLIRGGLTSSIALSYAFCCGNALSLDFFHYTFCGFFWQWRLLKNVGLLLCVNAQENTLSMLMIKPQGILCEVMSKEWQKRYTHMKTCQLLATLNFFSYS